METFIKGCQSFINHKEMDFSTTRGRKRFFIDFLKYNNVFLQYRKNFIIEQQKHAKNDTIKGLLSNFYLEMINYGFTWTETPQGHSFWSNLNQQWKNYIREKI